VLDKLVSERTVAEKRTCPLFIYSGPIFLDYRESNQSADVFELFPEVTEGCAPVNTVDVGMHVVEKFPGIN
jgi:hypothetical protein